jgi:paraquat-inducible protein B
MNRKTNPTVIGAFVVGAVILIAVAFALFGGSQIFKAKNRYVALFDEPTNGLRVGANVLLNGVRIGYVSDIDLLIDEVNFSTDTQVTLEVLPEDIMTRSGGSLVAQFGPGLSHDVLINKAGLRATLALESFVTGQLHVELQLRPEMPAVMRSVGAPYPEIPTITSNTQELLNRVQSWFVDIEENVDFAKIGEELTHMLEGFNEIIDSKDLRESLTGFNQLVNNADIQSLAESMQVALADLRKSIASADELFRQTGENADELLAELRPVLENLNATLREAEQTLKAAKAQLNGESDQAYEFAATLDELQRAASTVREFFDYLERNPEALLRGKSP